MSRFDFDDDGEGVPWGFWNEIVSRALGGSRGQQALADMEAALLALPEPKLIEGHLADDGGVCAVGAYVAHRQAVERGEDIHAVIREMSAKLKCWCTHARGAHEKDPDTKQVFCTGKRWDDAPCGCQEFDPEDHDPFETVEAGKGAGMLFSVAWHMAHMNDEKFAGLTPEQRYERMLEWVRRAQGKEVAA